MAINDNARYAIQYLRNKYNLTPDQAAGVVGNLIQESGMRTNAINPGDGRDGSDSIGIAQWNGQRARNLHAFANANERTVGDLDLQLDFVMHEMNGSGAHGGGSERRAYNRLLQAENYDQATLAMLGYERPQGWTLDNPAGGHGYANRRRYAGMLMGLSPDEIAQAQPTNQNLATNTRAQTDVANVARDDTKPTEKPADKKGLFGLTLPDQILGADTKDAIGALSGLAQILGGDQGNVAPPSGGRASTENVEIIPANTGGLLNAGPQQHQAALSPIELELMRLRQQMGGSGGLGGLGGMGRYL